MFDHECVKNYEIFSIFFLHVNSKKLVTKKYEVIGPSMHNSNQFIFFQNLF